MANQPKAVKSLKIGTYHPVGTDLHMSGHKFKVVGVDHKNKSYKLQHVNSGAVTEHTHEKVHNAFPPGSDYKKHIEDKISLTKAMIKTSEYLANTAPQEHEGIVHRHVISYSSHTKDHHLGHLTIKNKHGEVFNSRYLHQHKPNAKGHKEYSKLKVGDKVSFRSEKPHPEHGRISSLAFDIKKI